MAEPQMTHLPLSGLTPQQAGHVVAQTADLVFVLDADNRIAEVHGFGEMAEAVCPDWTGRPLAAIPGIDSRAKVALLLADDAARPGNTARWRHLNIARTGQETLPLLLKYFGFAGPGRAGNLVVGRDLRPTMAMQARVQRALVEMERSNEMFAAEFAPAEPAGRAGHDRLDPLTARAVEAIGHQPLDRIVRETAGALARLCVVEALHRTGEDRSAAARLLGITREELDARLAHD